MFSKELQQLIEASLVDGVLTDKERTVIRKRALLEGIDPDEVDVLLDAELAKLSIAKSPKKHGEVRKCPNCGAVIEALSTKCPECGYTFAGVEANKSSQVLANMIEDARAKFHPDRLKATENGKIWSDQGAKIKWMEEEAVASVIKTFPVPITKEDLFEFLTTMRSQMETSEGVDIPEAYRIKYKECLLKAKSLFPNDPKFSPFFMESNTLSYKLWKGKSGSYRTGMRILFFFILSFILCFIMAKLTGEI